MKTLLIYLEDSEYQTLSLEKMRLNLTWKELLKRCSDKPSIPVYGEKEDNNN